MNQEILSHFDLQIILDSDFNIKEIDSAWALLLECSEEEIVGKNINYFLSKINTINKDNLKSYTNTECEVEMISCKGVSSYLEVCLIEGNSYLLFGRDITSLRKAQLKLRQLEHHSKAGFWERTRGGTTSWSDEIFHIFEVPITPISLDFYETLQNCFINNAQNLITTNVERVFNEGGSYDLELEILTPGGKRKWVRTTGVGIEHNGKIIRAEGFIQDVTSYRDNVTRLFESQERLQFAISAFDIGIWQLNTKTNEVEWDSNMLKIFGVKEAPRTKEEFYKLIHPDDIGRLHADSLEGLANRQSVMSSFRIVVDGEVRYIASRGRLIHSFDGDYYIGLNWDITKEKLDEEMIKIQEAKIIASARLSSLGEMAGGIAHEINNPLSVILARTNQLKRRAIKGDIHQEELVIGLSKLEETCNRIVTIINGLRTISRDGNNDPFELVSLQKCIRETVSLITEKLKNSNVQINVQTPPEDILVKGRLVQLEQVLMNILHNSYDAIVDLPQKKINIELIHHSNKAEIKISDSGNGVPKHMEEKIFMPFFTTKDVGKGTGIGLSISKTIIEEHGGEFSYVSDNEKGTWYFSLIFPVLI